MVTSKKKAKASRAPKHVRPKRAATSSSRRGPASEDRSQTVFEIGNRVHVKMGAPAAYRGQSGQIVAAPEAARYEVLLDDGPTVPLHSWWLERV